MAAKKKTTRTFTNCFDQTFTVSTKKQPAKKAKRKAREWFLVIDVYDDVKHHDVRTVDRCVLERQDPDAEIVRVREVLPRTRTRKEER